MNWFKFYGQDYLTDLKLMRLRVEDRLCFITLLCLASASDEQGTISRCDEDAVIDLTHLKFDPYDDDNNYTRATGFLKRLEEMGIVTISNAGDVTVNNFVKRQDSNLTNAERQERWRKNNPTKHKESSLYHGLKKYKITISDWENIKDKYENCCANCGITGENSTLTVDHIIPKSKGGLDKKENYQPLCRSCNSSKRNRSNADNSTNVTLEKIREEKIRVDKREEKPSVSVKYLSQIPEEDLKEFNTRFIASMEQIKGKAEDLKLYCEARGKRYNNYKSFLLNALKKDFKERPKDERPKIKEWISVKDANGKEVMRPVYEK